MTDNRYYMTADGFRSLLFNMRQDKNWAHQVEWARTVARPINADEMAGELIFVIANSGMRAPTARKIYDKVIAALESGGSAHDVFGHKGKAAGMDSIWSRRGELFEAIVGLSDPEIVEWCGELPWIGGITKYHAAKNLGADVMKPDRWLVRIAAISKETPHDLCQRLANETGERIGVVDLVLWYALSSGAVKLDRSLQHNINSGE